jgi:DNA-binding NarL/FixJ family response regulator
MVDIVLVEATRTTRESLADLLESQPDLRVVGAPESLSTTAVDASEPISLLVVCVDRSDDFDWSVLRDVTGRIGAVRVVFVMADTAPDLVGRALTEGASAIIHRRASPVGFLDGIRQAAAGHTVVVPPANGLRDIDVSGVQRLTRREHEVLRLAAKGDTSRQIGKGLGVTERTVSAHLESAYRKLGVNTRVAAIDVARRAGGLP